MQQWIINKHIYHTVVVMSESFKLLIMFIRHKNRDCDKFRQFKKQFEIEFLQELLHIILNYDIKSRSWQNVSRPKSLLQFPDIRKRSQNTSKVTICMTDKLYEGTQVKTVRETGWFNLESQKV